MESIVFILMNVGMLLIAIQNGDTHPCGGGITDPPGAVKFCQEGNATGQAIWIVSGAQKFANVSCLCYVKTDAESSGLFVSYMLQTEIRNCGLKIKISDIDQEFSCNNTKANMQSNVTKFHLYKTGTVEAEDIAAGMCLRISIDSDHNVESTNATVTVTCHAVNAGTSTASVLSSLSSETTTTSPVTNSSTEERQSTDAVHSVHSPTSSKETSKLTEGYTTKVPPQIGDDESSNGEQRGIVVGAVVGGSVVLVTAIIVIVCCYWRRRQKAKFTRDYVNTASDQEITDNVVYNMEFPEDMKQPQMSLNDMNTTYHTIDNVAHQHEKETSSPVPYTNLQLDNGEGTYNTVDMDENQLEEKTNVPVKYKNLHFSKDAGADNIVDCDNSDSNIQTETRIDSSRRPGLDTDPAYDTLGRGKDTDTMYKINFPAAEQNQTPSTAYVVVNKAKSSDNTKDSDRPNQLQVAESGDTYAVVNKKRAK